MELKMLAAAWRTHMSEQVGWLQGNWQRSSIGKSSLQITHMKGGGSLNTPDKAESTAATAARPALANSCNVRTAAFESIGTLAFR
jgi:hypothetical protein